MWQCLTDILSFRVQCLISVIHNVHGNAFKLNLYRCMIEVLKTLAPVTRLQFSSLYATMDAFPHTLLILNGPLHGNISEWLYADEESTNRVHQAALHLVEHTLLASSTEESAADFKVQRVREDDFYPMQRCLQSWQKSAEHLQRLLLFLLAHGVQITARSMCSILEPHLLGLYARPYKPQGMNTRIYLAINALLNVCLPRTLTRSRYACFSRLLWTASLMRQEVKPLYVCCVAQ